MKNSEIRQFVLKVITTGMGIGCIVAGIFMVYQEKTMPIANVSIPAGLIFLVAGLILFGVASKATKTKNNPTSRKIWYAVFLILVVFLIIYAFTHYKFREANQYTILVDLILVIMALTGTIGYGVYRWISAGVEDRVTKAIKEGETFTRADVETSLGLWYFEQYQAESKRKEKFAEIREKLNKIQSGLKSEERSKTKHNPINNDPMDYLERAIERTMTALEVMKRLDKKKYEEFICICKNNLAYYLAERQKHGRAEEGDEELAKSYADYIRKRIGKYPHNRKEWSDTCDSVDQQFPNNDH